MGRNACLVALALLVACRSSDSHPQKFGGVITPGNPGTITSVATPATGGITGGASSGAVQLSLPTTCGVGQALSYVGNSWQCQNLLPNAYTSTHQEWFDEWLMFQVAVPTGFSGMTLGSTYGFTATGTAQVTGAVTGVTGHPGILELTTGTTAVDVVEVATSPNAVNFGDGNWSIEGTVGYPILSSGAQEYGSIFGFFDNASLNQTDGCYIATDRANTATSGPNSGNAQAFECWCAQNNVRTAYLINNTGNSDESFPLGIGTVGTLAYPNTNFYRLGVYVTSSAGTPQRAEFKINGVKVCDINTNLPSGSTRLTGAGMMMIKSVGTTAAKMDIDQTLLAVDLATARPVVPFVNTRPFNQAATWGDSLTYSGATLWTPYPTQWATASGLPIFNGGINSSTSTQIRTAQVADVPHQSWPTVIWAGRNNYTDPTTVKADIAAMVADLTDPNYIVLGVINAETSTEYSGTTNYNTIVTLNSDLATLYGTHFIDIRTLLVAQYDPAIPADVTSHSRDCTPFSLRTTGDSLHLNTAGFHYVETQVDAKMIALATINGP